MKYVRGYSLVFIPRSWALGVWRKSHKTIYALGPFRFAVHRALGPWRQAPTFEPIAAPKPFKPSRWRGEWLSGPSRFDKIEGGGMAGGCMEPIAHTCRDIQIEFRESIVALSVEPRTSLATRAIDAILDKGHANSQDVVAFRASRGAIDVLKDRNLIDTPIPDKPEFMTFMGRPVYPLLLGV